MYKRYRQHDERDCGAACLATVLSYYKVQLSLASCRELVKIDIDGCNIYGLVDGARKEGFQADAYEGTYEELLEGLREQEFVLPMIAHVHSEEGFEHFVVLIGCGRRYVKVFDPAQGMKRLSIAKFCRMWTGHIVVMRPGLQVRQHNESREGWKRYIQLLNGQHMMFMLAIIISGIIVAISLAGSFLYEGIIDRTMIPDQGKIFLMVAGLYAAQAILQITKGKMVANISQKIDRRLTGMLLEKIYMLPLKYFETMRSGEMLSRFTELGKIRDALINILLILIFDIVCFLGSTVVMGIVSPVLLMITMIIVALYIGIIIIFKPIIARIGNQTMSEQAKTISDFKELIDGREILKYYGGRRVIDQKLQTNYYNYSRDIQKRNMVFSIEDSLIGLISSIGMLLVLWLGLGLVAQGKLTMGLLMTFSVLISYAMMPIREIVELQPTLQEAYMSAQRLNDVLDATEEEVNVEWRMQKDYDLDGDIEIRDLDYRYANHSLTLQNINLKIKKGEKIALIGENGCGKSTITKLLLRVDSPERGEIIINGHDICEMPIDQYRAKIAYVPQMIYLFNNTIRENLLLGNEDASEAEIEDAIEKCELKEWVQQLPNGLDTLIEENGRNLSGGQKQRIAIARIMLKKPELIILDEATNQIDGKTDRKILSALFETFSNITCIIITHKADIMKMCDQVVNLNDINQRSM